MLEWLASPDQWVSEEVAIDWTTTGQDGGGNITVEAQDSIATGAIETSTENGAAGDVILDPENNAGGVSDFSSFSDLDPLPAARQKVLSIVQHLWRDALLLNEDFTRANLVTRQEAINHGIVHLATHASFESGEPSNSYIQLFGEQLRLDEVSEMGWEDMKLLVLSACETATGDEDAELGFGGAAVQTGTETVLANLWKVNDLGMLGLMAEFYQQLNNLDVTIKAEALRRAQVAMLEGHIRFEDNLLEGTDATVFLPPELQGQSHLNLAQPYFWSGFTLVRSPW